MKTETTGEKALWEACLVMAWRKQSPTPSQYTYAEVLNNEVLPMAAELYASDRLDSYKEALRSAIEKQIKEIDEFYKDKDTSIGSAGHASMMAESLSHHSFIKLLNSVTPKE